MHHARQHSQTRTRERRQRLAHEAARLMAEGGIGDYHQAKRKAAERLGIHDDASLPGNREIEDALRQYQRLFIGEAHHVALAIRRQAAVRALEFFSAFHPRLVGSVLEGTADGNSPVQLHLHSDDEDAVDRWLLEQGIPADRFSRRVRLDRERELEVAAWAFTADDLPIDVTVLPYDALRQAPRSVLDERPMKRASLAQVRDLVAGDALGAYGADARNPLA